MRSFMHQCAVHRAVVVRPLLLNVNKRPLPAAEFEMLYSGKLKIVFFGIRHTIRMQLTPSGKLSVSTTIS